MSEIITKKCTHCGKELPVSMFHKSSSSSDGYQAWCKPCINEDARKRHARKRAEKFAAQQAANQLPPSVSTFVTVDGKTYNKVEPKAKTLEEYTPRELLAELKRRGYIWSDMYVKQTVAWDKI